MMEFFLQLAVVLIAIAIGGRFSGIGLGAAGGLGLAVLVFVFGMKPGSPPSTVVFIIVSVITCVTILQVAGGLDLLVSLAEKMLRKRPDMITFLGPITVFIFTVFCGTSYVAFSIYPVIAEIAMDAKVRPERAMSMSVMASNMGIVASPMSAAVAGMIAITAGIGTTPLAILAVTLPGCFLGVIVGCFYMSRKGVEMEDDPIFQQRVKSGAYVAKPVKSIDNLNIEKGALTAVIIFFIAIVAIITMGSVASLRPAWENASGEITRMSIPIMLQIVMLTTAAIIMIVCKIPSDKLDSGSVFKAGLIGVVAVFGLSWMTGTFFDFYQPLMEDKFSGLLQSYPALFGVILFLLSMVIYSPAATVAALMPIGVKLGLDAGTLVGLMPAACATFIVPGAAQIACASFDRTGTTKIGKYVINHSYLVPGVIALLSSTIFCWIIAKFIF